jgi:hypothetical protein
LRHSIDFAIAAGQEKTDAFVGQLFDGVQLAPSIAGSGSPLSSMTLSAQKRTFPSRATTRVATLPKVSMKFLFSTALGSMMSLSGVAGAEKNPDACAASGASA